MSNMKLLVFAHTPPPHHGQSLMVQILVDGFGGDCRHAGASALTTTSSRPHGIELYHVNARLSTGPADVGVARGGKWFRLLRYCAQAIGARMLHRADILYYVPAPARRTPLLRDWAVMALCRPFFSRLILHWHAVGLGAWLETAARPWERWLTRRLLGGADLALVLSEANRGDAERLQPLRVLVVANGIADPCPDCEHTVLPARRARRERLVALLSGAAPGATTGASEMARGEVARAIFVAHCSRDKGLFDAVEAVAIANASLDSRGVRLRLELTVAGEFLIAAERQEFDGLQAARQGWLRYAGFVRGDAKEALFRSADVFVFPTYYANEGQPVALIEAMAFGLPVVVTRWRAIPEALPDGYAGLVEPGRPDLAAVAILNALTEDGARLREQFTGRFRVQTHLENLARALHSLDRAASGQDRLHRPG